jgi:hypothetical protein
MRFDLNLSAAVILVSRVMMGSAAAQTDQTAAQGANNNSWVEAPGGPATSAYDGSGVTPGSDAAPERLSDGTLAESANTTALASSTYHQPTGFLPGMKP